MNTQRRTSQLAIIGVMAFAAACLLSNPAYARWGGGGFGGGGAGFRMGGDGFAGGNPSYAAARQSAYSSNQAARFNQMNSMNQTRYNQAQSMQNKSYQNRSTLSQQRYNQAGNLQSNQKYYPSYGGCCGSSGSSNAGAAALGMMSGMAMGSAMGSARRQQPSTIVNVQAPPATPYGTAAPGLPPGATPVQVNGSYYYYSNGTYYKPEFNGSQVVYVPSPM